jgi:hypothetical protein
LQSYREGAFTGYFGCIGVSAVFYVQVALENIPEERERLRAVITPVVYFMVLTSVIVHGECACIAARRVVVADGNPPLGITIPLGKGFHHTLTINKTRSSATTAVLNLPKAPFDLPVRPASEAEEGGSVHAAVVTHRPDDQTITFEVPMVDRSGL